MNYKLVAIDLDGTLLDDNKILTVENRDILKKLIDKGVEIVIATGRRYWAAKNFMKDLNENIVIISNNGNVIRNIKDDKIILEKYINRKDFIYILEQGKKNNLYPIVHINGYEKGYDFLIEKNQDYKGYNNYLDNKEDRCKKINNFLEYKENNIMVLCYFGDYEKLNRFINIISQDDKRFSYHIMTNLKKVGPMLEIMNPLGSKWKSILEYSKGKGISREEIITLGDDNNDMEMIKYSGCGIAMKNANKQVKEVSDIISSEDNNNSGVAIELKKVFNIK